MAETGDPAGMRRQAAQYRRVADRLRLLATRLAQKVSQMDYLGPAATRFRALMHRRRERIQLVARDLDELADYLVREASRVEQAQGAA